VSDYRTFDEVRIKEFCLFDWYKEIYRPVLCKEGCGWLHVVTQLTEANKEEDFVDVSPGWG
jgi:hypothetical protein